MSVLVTGASGFVGAAVLRALDRAGREGIAGTRTPERDAPRLRGWAGRRVHLDPMDRAQLGPALDAVRPHAVVHTAIDRSPGVVRRVARAVEAVEAVIGAAAAAGVEHVVVLGSGAEYGRAPAPMREDGPCVPTTEHGVAKAAASAVAAMHAARVDGPTVTVLRPFHVTGRGEPLGKLVPRILDAAHGGPPLRLVATDPVRDLVHVQDVAAGILAALAAPAPDLPVNLCSGVAVTPREVVAAVEAALGRRVPVDDEAAPPSPYDGEHRVGDPARARDLWGWEAAGLDEVARRCVAAWPWEAP